MFTTSVVEYGTVVGFQFAYLSSILCCFSPIVFCIIPLSFDIVYTCMINLDHLKSVKNKGEIYKKIYKKNLHINFINLVSDLCNVPVILKRLTTFQIILNDLVEKRMCKLSNTCTRISINLCSNKINVMTGQFPISGQRKCSEILNYCQLPFSKSF